MRFEGDPVRVAPGGQVPSVSNDGTLAYVLDRAMGLRQMVWIDAKGHVVDRIGEPQPGIAGPQLSHDGRRILYSATDGDVQNLFVLDLARGIRTRVVADSNDKTLPIWSPDGNTIYYNLSLTAPEVWGASVDGSTPPHDYAPGYFAVPTPDGRWLLYVHEERGHESIWRRSISGDSVGAPLWRAAGIADNEPSISRDGRWLAYVSDESGTGEVYVRAFPSGTGKQLVSRRGGDGPLWSPGGDAIYFIARDTVFRVAAHAGATLELGEPRALFAVDDVGDYARLDDVAADGRLLGTVRSAADPRRGILLVEHWTEELRGR
jgi:serine/threonine-protein kinase